MNYTFPRFFVGSGASSPAPREGEPLFCFMTFWLTQKLQIKIISAPSFSTLYIYATVS